MLSLQRLPFPWSTWNSRNRRYQLIRPHHFAIACTALHLYPPDDCAAMSLSRVVHVHVACNASSCLQACKAKHRMSLWAVVRCICPETRTSFGHDEQPVIIRTPAVLCRVCATSRQKQTETCQTPLLHYHLACTAAPSIVCNDTLPNAADAWNVA